MKKSEVTDHIKKTHTISYYDYDAFGRRTLVQDENGKLIRTLYDAFSFDIIREQETFADGYFTNTRDTGIQWGKVSEGDGSRYRYIGDDAPAAKEQNGYSVTATNRASSRVALYANGQAVGVTRSSNYASSERSYFGTDLMGTVRSSTKDSGNAEYYEYDFHLLRSRRRETKRIISDSCSLINRPRKRTDVFGKPLGENISDFAYTGKPYDPTTGMYNYGYRDYSPQTARFTTVDPIRDGSNWFVYCNNEPVNFVDAWGLSASDGKARDCGIYDGEGNYTQKCKDDAAKFKFNNTIFTADNPLNQLDLDKALNIKSDSKTTQSCQTTAMINAYAVNNQNGITGKEIVSALTNEDGSLKKTLCSDGSPSCMLEDISKDLASACGSTLYLKPAGSKMSVSLLADLSAGAILGYAKTSSKKKIDSHFGYKNWTYTIDSLDPNRLAAINYEENSYRILQWSSLK